MSDKIQPKYTEEQLQYSKIETKSGQTLSLKFRKKGITNKEIDTWDDKGIDVEAILLDETKMKKTRHLVDIIYVGSLLSKQGVSLEEYREYIAEKDSAWRMFFVGANAEFIENAMVLMGHKKKHLEDTMTNSN